MSKPLLSICIPTYNRADKLYHSLEKILASISSHSSQIEVIVSDNASDDSTQEIIAKLKKQYPILQNYRNSENLGFNCNIFALSDKYATGKYLWILGDDDFIDACAVNTVIEIIKQNPLIEFIGLNFRLLQTNEAVSWNKEPNDLRIKLTTVEHVIDMQSRTENILTTFLSCNVVLRDKFAAFDKSVFSTESWDNYMSVFPHAYINAKTIYPKHLAAYISTPLMSVCIHQKNWDDKLAELHLSSIVHIYKHYIECGYINMKNSRKVIIKGGISFLFKRKVDIDLRQYFWCFVRFSPTFYFSLISALYHKILR